jgi:release factor glutamine methyltransferase
MRSRDPGPPLDAAVARLRDAGVVDPRLDATLLLAHALGVARLDVLTASDAARRRATPAALRRFRALVARRARRVPLQHLTGACEFHGRPFRVTPAVLVPRPETETLVNLALAHLKLNFGSRIPNPESVTRRPKSGIRNTEFGIRAADIGTGSGAIAVTLACERPDAEVVATDISRPALTVARANARRLGAAKRIRFLAGDLFAPLRRRRPPAAPVDLICSNPPYIATRDLARCQPEVRDHEPRAATHAGRDGLAVIRRLLAEAPDFLAPGGALLVEVGAGQALDVLRLAGASGRYLLVRAMKDLAGIDRVVVAEMPRG